MSIPCPICSEKFGTLGSMKFHFRQVHGKKLTVCPLCGKKCKNAQGLRFHCLQTMKKGDMEHAVLYYLLLSNRKARKVLESLPHLREGAFEVLRRGGLSAPSFFQTNKAK